MLFIVLKLLNGFYEYEIYVDNSFQTAKQLIFTTGHFYLYISILFLLKGVLVDHYHQEILRTDLNWIIKLNSITAALSIMVVLGLGRYLIAIIPILLIAELIFYVRFFGNVMLINKQDVPAILQLQRFIKAIMIVFAALIIFSVFMKYAGKPELRYLRQLLFIIPFAFVGTFFYKTLKTIYP